MIREIAGLLLSEAVEEQNPSTAGAISDKVAKTYFPHLQKISQKYGVPVESLIDTWDNIVESLRMQDAATGSDPGPLNRFIRASLLLHSMIGTQKP